MKYFLYATLLCGLIAGTPLTALAGNVLFHGTAAQVGIFTRTNATIPSATPKVLQTTTNGFTIPSGAFSVAGSTYTATFAGYPYFRQTNYRKNLAGHVYDGGVPTGTALKTGLSHTQAYPSSGVTTVPPGWIRIKPGGFGGPIPMSRATIYEGTFAGGAGFYNFGFFWGGCGKFSTDCQTANGGIIAPAVYGDSSDPIGKPFIASTAVHTSIVGLYGGAIGVANPQVKFFTGTVTISAPSPFEATYAMATGMDNRTPAGQSGTIQLVSARRIMYYVPATIPPPFDGSSAINNQRSGSGGLYKFSLEFVPEPTQIALLAAGVLGLGMLLRVRRF